LRLHFLPITANFLRLTKLCQLFASLLMNAFSFFHSTHYKTGLHQPDVLLLLYRMHPNEIYSRS